MSGRLITAALLASTTLHAATYYVASTGSDMNVGSSGSPWLTLAHAAASVACGDTIVIVANGVAVAGDVTLPPFPNCGNVTNIQSSRLNEFMPVGYRTNPTADSSRYGKLSFQPGGGIVAAPAVYTANFGFSISPFSVNVATSTITLTQGSNALTYPALANGMIVEIEIASSGSNYGGATYPPIAPPGGTTFLTHYYVRDCSTMPACGDFNSTFKLAATSGGTAITITSCGAYCANTVTSVPMGACTLGDIQYNTTNSTFYNCGTGGMWASGTGGALPMWIGVSQLVDTAADTITMTVNYGSGSLANGMAVAFSAAGFQVFGTLPAPLVLDATYCIVGLTGTTFQLATVCGGTVIDLTDTGTGMVNFASTGIAHHWALRGLELAPSGSSLVFNMMAFGFARETSIVGMANHFEVDRVYCHDNPPTIGVLRCVLDNGTFVYIHDSWLGGANDGEAQAIAGIASPGPTAIVNNFLEASGEVTLYGGDFSPYSPANANKQFLGNYFYKPPVWRLTTGTGAPAGTCFYDTYDASHSGGEFYYDSMAMQYYQCQSNFTWATSMAPTLNFSAIQIKNMAEHKNGRYFTYSGNVFRYSFALNQAGYVWNNSMEYGSGPGMANDHITAVNNAAYDSFVFLSRNTQCLATSNAVCPILPGYHNYSNNLMVANSQACGVGGVGCGFQGYQANAGATYPNNFTWDAFNHNTIWLADTFPYSTAPMIVDGGASCPPYSPLPVIGFTMANSIAPRDLVGTCATGTISPYYQSATFRSNALVGAVANYSTPGATNSFSPATAPAFPANNTVVKFVSCTTGTVTPDCRLDPTSPYSADNGSATMLATDGSSVGIDGDVLNMAKSGAVAGTPSWDQQAGLSFLIGSTKAVIRYTAPTSAGACTATIYNSPVRVAGNAVATVLDSGASSISNSTTRELLITGLTASTQYWGKLSCGGGVLIILDPFITRPAGGTLQFPLLFSSAQAVKYCTDKALTVGCTTTAAATTVLVPVASNATIYAQSTTAGADEHVLVAP